MTPCPLLPRIEVVGQLMTFVVNNFNSTFGVWIQVTSTKHSFHGRERVPLETAVVSGRPCRVQIINGVDQLL